MTTELKTSYEWYQEDKTMDICDPDGWDRKSKAVSAFWHKVKISRREYEARKATCSTLSYNMLNHASPFPKDKNCEWYMEQHSEAELRAQISAPLGFQLTDKQ